MATVTMTTVDNILKEVYEPKLRDQLQSETLTLQRIEKSSEGVTHEVGGKYVAFPIRTQRNHGIGARLEREALPIPRAQAYQQARVRLKYLYGSLELTGQVFELAESNFQAFASALDQEVSGLREGLKKDFNRQVYGTNLGILATRDQASSTTTLVTNNGQYVEEGMVVDVGTVLDGTVDNSAVVVSAVAPDTPVAGQTTITFASTITAPVAGKGIWRDNSYGKEITGLSQIVAATGAVYNLDPATVPIWKSYVKAVGGNITEGEMTATVDAIRSKGSAPTAIYASVGVRRAYANLLMQLRRIVNTTEMKGGFSGIAFTTDHGEIPVFSDWDCQPGRMYFVNEKELKFYEAADWSFMNRDGSNWQRVIDASGNYDAYMATLFKYVELGTHRRNAHALLTGITEA